MFRHTFDNGETVMISQDEISGSFLLPGHCDHVIKDVLQLKDNIEKGYPCHMCNTEKISNDVSQEKLSKDKTIPSLQSSNASSISKLSRVTSANSPKGISSNIGDEKVIRMPKAFDPPMANMKKDHYVNELLKKIILLSKDVKSGGVSNESNWIMSQRKGFDVPGIDIGILEIFRNKDYSEQRKYFINYDFSGGKNEDIRRTVLHLGK